MNTRRSIQKIAGTLGSDSVTMLTCTVESVSIPDRTCTVTPINGLFTSFPAFLMPEIDDGVLIVPSTGSTVKIIYSNRNAPTVVQYSQIDQVLIIAGNQKYSITNGLQQFNDGSYGGLVKLLDPDDSNAGLLARLNKLENIVKDLITQYNSHTHSYSPGTGAATDTGTTAQLESGSVAITTQSQLENTGITHGKQM